MISNPQVMEFLDANPKRRDRGVSGPELRVSIEENPRRRRRRRRRARAAARKSSSPRRRRRGRRRARRNPSTYIQVPGVAVNPRRRGRNGGGKLTLSKAFTGAFAAIVPAAAAVGTAIVGYIAGKTFLKEKDLGVMGYVANGVGSSALAIPAAIALRKNRALSAGFLMGIPLGILMRVGIQALHGRHLPFGLVSGFEMAEPMTLEDFFTGRALPTSGVSDFLVAGETDEEMADFGAYGGESSPFDELEVLS